MFNSKKSLDPPASPRKSTTMTGKSLSVSPSSTLKVSSDEVEDLKRKKYPAATSPSKGSIAELESASPFGDSKQQKATSKAALTDAYGKKASIARTLKGGNTINRLTSTSDGAMTDPSLSLSSDSVSRARVTKSETDAEFEGGGEKKKMTQIEKIRKMKEMQAKRESLKNATIDVKLVLDDSKSSSGGNESGLSVDKDDDVKKGEATKMSSADRLKKLKELKEKAKKAKTLSQRVAGLIISDDIVDDLPVMKVTADSTFSSMLSEFRSTAPKDLPKSIQRYHPNSLTTEDRAMSMFQILMLEESSQESRKLLIETMKRRNQKLLDEDVGSKARKASLLVAEVMQEASLVNEWIQSIASSRSHASTPSVY